MTLAELIAAANEAGFVAFCARGAPTAEEPLNMHDHEQLTRIERMLERLLQLTIEKDRTIMLDISNLTAAVTNCTTVEQSAVTLIQGVAAEVAALVAASANSVDPAALQALSDKLNASASALSAAVVANTPAAPPAPATP